MKAVMVMFDSLNRHMLSPYGCEWVHTPNFNRLSERTATFENCYVGSMPCMPARREIHTGRYNFLHRSWGPLEPFDDSMPRMLWWDRSVQTSLISDHYHYWEAGGCTYHTSYATWDAVRGQEGDQWMANHTEEVSIPETRNRRPDHWIRQDFVNRHYMPQEEDFPQAITFRKGMEFLRTNASADHWMLHMETFDPHEPYFVPERFLEMYPHAYDGPLYDWPDYDYIESHEHREHLRHVNAALVTMCDEYLGKLMDLFDELDLWRDTLLIVNTDHGFLLGEHNMLAKCWCPFYNEIARTPLFVHDPRVPEAAGQRRRSLVQTIDLAPTLLEFFGMEPTADMQGKPLRDTLADDTPIREAGLFGIHGGQVNVTDGRYVYMRAPADETNQPLFEYTQMPTHMRTLFDPKELQDIRLARPMSFTKGCPTMQIPTVHGNRDQAARTMLFDLQTDPAQDAPLQDADAEGRMIGLLTESMQASDAPPEQYERLGLANA